MASSEEPSCRPSERPGPVRHAAEPAFGMRAYMPAQRRPDVNVSVIAVERLRREIATAPASLRDGASEYGGRNSYYLCGPSDPRARLGWLQARIVVIRTLILIFSTRGRNTGEPMMSPSHGNIGSVSPGCGQVRLDVFGCCLCASTPQRDGAGESASGLGERDPRND